MATAATENTASRGTFGEANCSFMDTGRCRGWGEGGRGEGWLDGGEEDSLVGVQRARVVESLQVSNQVGHLCCPILDFVVVDVVYVVV